MILQWMESNDKIKDSLPVFDLKKNIYTARPIPNIKSKVDYSHHFHSSTTYIWLLLKVDFNYEFEEKDRENPRVLNYVISIQPTGEVEIDLFALKTYCESGTSIDPPLRPIQALDIALKYGAQRRYHRSLK